MIKKYIVKIVKTYYFEIQGKDCYQVLDQVNYIINNTNNLEKPFTNKNIKIKINEKEEIYEKHI